MATLGTLQKILTIFCDFYPDDILELSVEFESDQLGNSESGKN